MDCVAMDEDCEEEKLMNSRGKNLQSSHWKDHKIISEKEFWMESSMEQEAKLLMERARDYNRRKDLLYVLLSYPMKQESDQADLFLLRDNFIKLNRMIKGLDSTMKKNSTNLGQLVEKDIPAVLEDVECCLAKHDSYIKLYDACLKQHCDSKPEHEFRHKVLARVIDSSVHQILHCFEGEQLKVIAISGYSAEMVTAAVEYQSVKRGMFNLVINVCVQEGHGICEVRNSIAQEIHGLTGTDISLPLDETLKPYKFLLFLDCRKQIIDPRDLKIPKHGSVVLGFRHRNVHDIGLVDLEIRMEDHLLPWSLFWKNVDNFPSSKIEPIASQLVELCHSHLLAIILLARALKSVTDVRVWQHALGELSSSSFSSPMEGRSHEVMVVVLKFVWERKSIVTRHCIKHSCTLVTKDIKLEKTSLLSCWIENDLIETETAGKHVLEDLIKSFLLEEVSEGYVRMREETREVLLKQFIPHLHPLYLKQEGLGLSEAPEVAEWDAKEIYLNNNHLSELPEKPNCPSLVTLLLQENFDLMEIPSSFFECMPMLQVLDLSHTSIKSLPASISRLVSLQELFLRGCELLMELPPEIGALLKLQVLDLEGTEIMYLPKEISGLTKLECLKVSLYGHGKCYREGKQICKRIPAGLLASLCMLKALSIDVNPDDDEWVADVKDVTDELLKLELLMSLKLYLPEVGLLKEITSVRNFKFTVGRHKQCIISCLPHEVEEEFEKLENCLKYINGKYIPIEIQNALKCTHAFFLERHWTVKNLSEFGNENMVDLNIFLLVECNELQTIIDGGEFYTEGDQMCESGVDKKLVFESLQYLGIHCMMNLRSIWEGPIGKGSLSKLKYMALHSCPNLTSIFTRTLLGNLNNLEELIIEDCPQINSLVCQESLCFEPNPFLPSLKKISLLDLPKLVSISSGLLFAPKLERIIIYACPMLESLSLMELSSNYLKVIKGEIEWWNSLKWLESEWSSKRKDYVANVFVELERDASLMDQLAESGNSKERFEGVTMASSIDDSDIRSSRSNRFRSSVEDSVISIEDSDIRSSIEAPDLNLDYSHVKLKSVKNVIEKPHNDHLPLIEASRHSYYQKPEEVVVTIFAKGVPAKNVSINFGEQILSVAIDVPGENKYHFQPRLFGKIVPDKCWFEVLSTKIEICLVKAEAINWTSLEYSKEVAVVPQRINVSSGPGLQRPSYPCSKPRTTDWDKLEALVKEEEKEEKLDGDAALNKLFGDIYKNADEDMRRAMLKSFVESDGTVLSTNWKY